MIDKKKTLGYRIVDIQQECYFAEAEIFNTKEDIIERLANFHDIDYEGVKDNDKPYDDIWEFLRTLKNDKERLEWLLDYGQWEIEAVTKENR